MKKWMIFVSVLLLVGLAGYWSTQLPKDAEEEEKLPAKEVMHEHEHEHEESSDNGDGGSVHAEVEVGDGYLDIAIKDEHEQYVSDLKVVHEKILHFIVVSSDLQFYRHLHPEQVGEGQFRIKHSLPDGYYKAFVDIAPEGKAYHVEPVPFIIGEGSEQPAVLHESKMMTVEQNGHSVTLSSGTWKANEGIKLSFDLNGENPEPYLGANGHVVILDERAEEFIHVHPSDHSSFHTQISNPGLYKVWAEFKFNGVVETFPFVIRVTD